MPFTIHTKADFISAAKHAPKPIAFLVGSPLSTDKGGGVPGIDEMLDLVREEILLRGKNEISRFEDVILNKTGAEAYQLAMRWLQGNFTQDAVNRVIELAVLKARRTGAPESFQDIGDCDDWYLPSGTKYLGKLLTLHRNKFPGPVLTTNFDPLISVAIETERGRADWHILESDGYFGRTAGVRRGETQVVHLHGYWRESDTLHTPDQLTSERPKLQASLQLLLRKKTLIVVAYSGWDDAFTKALVRMLNSGHPDDVLGVNVLWCFREDDANIIENKYRHILEQMPPGRFLAYGGIDCHTIFNEIQSTQSDEADSINLSDKPVLLAGWQYIDSDYLESLTPLDNNQLLKYFDGSVPTWRHAVSEAIPHRQAVEQIIERLKTFQPAQFGCSLQLIRAAGGEGKTTLLLQAASQAIQTGEWTVLWRPTPNVCLPAQHLLELDPDRLWLIVADDAENLVADLAESARILHEAGRSNVHFLLAARDSDWWSKFGDKPPWEQWLEAWVRRKDAITLRGITREDAKKIITAWTSCSSDGLRELASVPKTHQIDFLIQEIRNASPGLGLESGSRSIMEGSFFGGLLSVRFGQDGLQAHVRSFLNRLKEQKISGSSKSLFDALVFVAACHAAGIPGIEENILADLLNIPREWVQTLVVRPLGEEAAAVHNAGCVTTRHSKVASAILLEVDQTIDIAEVWNAIVKQTVKTGREVRIGTTYAMILHAGPRLWDTLPIEFSQERRTEIAIATAKAAVTHDLSWLGCVVSLGKTYRRAGQIANAAQLFRDNLASASSKTDYSEHIRGYWHEWGVSEGLLGENSQYRAADAWLDGLSLSDLLNPAPLTDENVKQSCVALGIALGILADRKKDCCFARGRRAAIHIGRQMAIDGKATNYFDRIEYEANTLPAPNPRDNLEAIQWLTTSVVESGRLLVDSFLKSLVLPESVSFLRLSASFSGRNQLNSDFQGNIGLVPDEIKKPSSFNLTEVDKTTYLAKDNAGNDAKKLRLKVFRIISDLIEKSILNKRLLYLPVVSKALNYKIPEGKSIYNILGFRTLTDLVLSFDEFVITGAHPAWSVGFREEWQLTPEKGLRYDVWTVTKELIEKANFEKRPLYLTVVGAIIASRFRATSPIYLNLGFNSFRELINSFDDFIVVGEHPRWELAYRSGISAQSTTDIRSEILVVIMDLFQKQITRGKPLLLLVVGNKLAEKFPEAKPIHKSLGFKTLTDLILSFDEFLITGDHPQWFIRCKDDSPSQEGEDLRFEVKIVIRDLIEKSISEQHPLYLPVVGYVLAERFPKFKPIHRSLGFENLTSFIGSFDEFVVVGEQSRWTVDYKNGKQELFGEEI